MTRLSATHTPGESKSLCNMGPNGGASERPAKECGSHEIGKHYIQTELAVTSWPHHEDPASCHVGGGQYPGMLVHVAHLNTLGKMISVLL